MKKIIKLCGGRRCCPTIEKVSDEEYEIKDDYGGLVKLKKDEIEIMYASLSEL